MSCAGVSVISVGEGMAFACADMVSRLACLHLICHLMKLNLHTDLTERCVCLCDKMYFRQGALQHKRTVYLNH